MIIDQGIFKTVPIADIQPNWEKRKRIQYNNIDQLGENIITNGLINPITVYSPTGDPPYILMAGGRRLKACQWAKLEEIAVHIYDKELSDLELRAIELYENLMRSDLPWEDQVNFTREIDEAFRALHGQGVQGKRGDEGHSLKKTAQMLGKSIGSVSMDKKLAAAIRELPELKLGEKKNKLAAMSALRRATGIIQSQIAVAKHTVSGEESNYILGDFFANTLPNKSFQFVEIDPPYAIDLINIKRLEDKQFIQESYNEIPKEEYPSFIQRLAKEVYRLATDNAWMVCWCGPQFYDLVKGQFELVGFDVTTWPGLWVKTGVPGQTHSPSTVLGTVTEMFIYGRKGNAQINTQGRRNVFDAIPVPPAEKIHPTERPLLLIKDIIKTFCWPGYNILVPFAGSGKTLVAAKELGYKGVGFDLSQEFRDKYIQRLVEGRVE